MQHTNPKPRNPPSDHQVAAATEGYLFFLYNLPNIIIEQFGLECNLTAAARSWRKYRYV